MASFFDELASYLDAQNASLVYDTASGRNVFKNELPPDPDTCVAFLGIVGTTLTESRDVKGLQFPRFQVVVRSKDYEEADTLLQAVRDTLHGLIGQDLPAWRIKRCHAEQDGGPIGQDDQGRHEFSINMIAEFHKIDWSVKYLADNLPQNASPAWTRYINGGDGNGPDVEQVSDGILTIECPDNNRVLYEKSGGSADMTLQMRAQVIDVANREGFAMAIDTGAEYGELVFYNDRIELEEDGVIGSYAMDTTDGFHVYRLSIAADGTVRVYVDGVLRISTSLTEGWGVSPTVWFGIFTNDGLTGQKDFKVDEVFIYENKALK